MQLFTAACFPYEEGVVGLGVEPHLGSLEQTRKPVEWGGEGYSSSLSLSSALDEGVSGECYTRAPLPRQGQTC